ncbi:MAG: methylated-DNA--[protein]-cysteine S-methyltransferase, partial [Bifidobacteriaceae bacterium]|nr:methylated-DNA--[protein]-cysteine S-methyltransferase [Bifidobacteriaceae bacterium]
VSGISQNNSLTIFMKVKSWLNRYFAGEQPKPDELSLAPIGGEFRQIVWQILREIPYGQVMSYGDIAKRIVIQTGKTKMSAQAVGGAVRHNPISIIIPCHRVVGKNGSLTGYAGGLEVKQKLLQLENVNTANLFMP